MDDRFRLLVTFDIRGARPGDKRYGRADELLSDAGDVIKVFKQVRLVSTSEEPRKLAVRLHEIIGPTGSVLISHAAKPYRFVVGTAHVDAAKRPKVGAFMKKAKG